MTERIKILLIEDHPIVRDGCLRILSRRADFDAIEASSATAGLAANRNFSPDVIILDLELPDVGGLEVIARAAARQPFDAHRYFQHV